MINQELLKRAKAMDVSFGEGEDMTLKALLEQMEEFRKVLDVALDLACDYMDENCDGCVRMDENCDGCVKFKDCGDILCGDAYREMFIQQAEQQIEEQSKDKGILFVCGVELNELDEKDRSFIEEFRKQAQENDKIEGSKENE